MPLQLHPLILSDFDILTSHAFHHAPGDDLVGPPTPTCWPVHTRSEAQKRLQFHMSAQKRRFLGDETVTYLKIIDSDTQEIISIARWHYYPSGYSYSASVQWELHNPSENIPGMNIALHNYILSTRDGEREKWMESGEPCWILMHLVTRSSHRGKGAAGMLIEWGVERARKEGVNAYLEAGIAAKGLYERYGFGQVGGILVLDLRPFGMEMDFVMAKMRLLR